MGTGRCSASMPVKCIAQIPVACATAPPTSHGTRRWPDGVDSRAPRLSAVNDPRPATTQESATKSRSYLSGNIDQPSCASSVDTHGVRGASCEGKSRAAGETGVKAEDERYLALRSGERPLPCQRPRRRLQPHLVHVAVPPVFT